MMVIPREQITGLVLAGGRGMRMGGVDKGLQTHAGMPLALHAVLRLAPQVGSVMVNANRNLAAYEALGVPVWPDAMSEFPGPLAGMQAGLEHCETPWLVCVPCDTPHFPTDLVERLAAAAASADADVAVAATREADGSVQRQPVFCLMRSMLLENLTAFLAGGQRKIEGWTSGLKRAQVVFDDAAAFHNANTLEELRALPRGG